MQKTKMIFTIGPSSDSEEILREFIRIGMNAARLNFSHGDHASHKEKIELIKRLRKEEKSATAILLDIKGPKIRTHNFKNGEAELKNGDEFTFSCGDEILGDNTKCSISYKELYEDIKPGGSILVDDGLLEFKVKEVRGTDIICEVIEGGTIKDHKGVNVPNVPIKLPAVTEKDRSDLIFGCEMEVDFVAASFIRKPEDVLEVREILDSHGGKDIKIISKIESQEGVDNIDSILEVSDAIMVARGDLGVEIPIEKVPAVQKMIIEKCNAVGKPVITATQMLDSMIRNPRPTRAEVSDVANAILDGTDAIMLSGESANGTYPVEAVQTMSRIATETEKQLDYEIAVSQAKKHIPAIGGVISRAACNAANELQASAIISSTQSGATARRISQCRPECPIIAVTPCEKVAKSLAFSWGVYPIVADRVESTDEMMDKSVEIAEKNGFVNKGETVVIAAGVPVDKVGATNLMKISVVE